jgi:hypothetical protein
VRKKDRKSFDTLVLFTAWRLWKQRNTRRIAEEFNLWKLARI